MRNILSVTGVVVALFGLACPGLPESGSVRPSVCQGSWYPADTQTLEGEVDGYLARVPPTADGQKVVGMVSPHAGYVYSGEVAAWGYRNLLGIPFRRVIVLGPSHYVAFPGISIPRADFYETPLGKIHVDRVACEALLRTEPFRTIPEAHQREHSVEMQLPFLQRTLKDFTLVPMVVGELQEEDYQAVSHELRALQDADTLTIASSDFTHFGPRFGYVPFKDNLRENIARLDQGAIDLILERDWKGFLAYHQVTGATICGFRPIGLLLKTLPVEAHGQLLRYTLSGDLTGDYTNSVSYASIIFTVPGEAR